MAKVIAAWFATMAVIRLAYSFAVSTRSLTRRVLLVGDPRQVGALTPTAIRRGRLLRSRRAPRPHGVLALLRRQRIWHVVVASEPKRQAVESLLDCKLRGMRISSARRVP